MNGTTYVIEKLGQALAQAEATIMEQAAEIERLQENETDGEEQSPPTP